MTPGGSHAGVRQPAWSADRYRGQPWRRYAEHAVLVLLGVAMAVLSLVDGRVLGASTRVTSPGGTAGRRKVR